MRLITEQNFDEVRFITEENKTGEKNLFIEGIFLQANIKNRNGRIYEDSVLRPVVDSFVTEKVMTGRAIGQLEHPPTISINLDRVSHRITEMSWNGNDVIGKAIILNTPTGKIARGLIEGGTVLGVSSRGTGSLEERNGSRYVKNDYSLVTVDVVADPSAPSAFVNGILEGVEFLYDDKGNVVEKQLDVIEKKIVDDVNEKKKMTGGIIDESTRLRDLERFLQRFV
jgi:hypothetical protein